MKRYKIKIMKYYLTYIRDSIGNNYLGLSISNDIVVPFLDQLKDILGLDDYVNYTKLQIDREHGKYHVTIINVMDYNAISKKMGMDKFVNSLDPILKYEIDDFKMLGIGTAEKNGNRSYFIVCNSEKLDAIRDRYELPKQDFHITLGFLSKDVFGVRKNVVIKKEGNFLKLLKQEYYNHNNCNFIKKIKNFDLNTQSEIIPISITDSSMKVKCDGYYMDVAFIEDKFWISTKYKIDKELPRLSETEIAKILKNK